MHFLIGAFVYIMVVGVILSWFKKDDHKAFFLIGAILVGIVLIALSGNGERCDAVGNCTDIQDKVEMYLPD